MAIARPPPRLRACLLTTTLPFLHPPPADAPVHADVAAITVNVALSDETEIDAAGGQLMGVFGGAVKPIHRQAGDASCHSSSLLHGVTRTRAEKVSPRYTLIIFYGLMESKD